VVVSRFPFQSGPGTHGSAGVCDARHKPRAEGEAELRARWQKSPSWISNHAGGVDQWRFAGLSERRDLGPRTAKHFARSRRVGR
jgi:hypothetical protein